MKISNHNTRSAIANLGAAIPTIAAEVVTICTLGILHPTWGLDAWSYVYTKFI